MKSTKKRIALTSEERLLTVFAAEKVNRNLPMAGKDASERLDIRLLMTD